MKAIIFDWDLTLWNSWDLHLRRLRRTADALGLPRPGQDAGAREFHRPFFQHLCWFFKMDQKRVVDTYMCFYQEDVTWAGRLYPQAADTLVALKDRGYLLGLFSDKRRSFGQLELDQSGIGDMLDYVMFLEDGRPYKPDPEGLIQVLSALGVPAEEAMYVGDASQDVECAHRAGVASGAALWGSVDRDELLRRQPSYRWERMDRILDSL